MKAAVYRAVKATEISVSALLERHLGEGVLRNTLLVHILCIEDVVLRPAQHIRLAGSRCVANIIQQCLSSILHLKSLYAFVFDHQNMSTQFCFAYPLETSVIDCSSNRQLSINAGGWAPESVSKHG